MLSKVLIDSAGRFSEVRSFLSFIAKADSLSGVSVRQDEIRSAKGLFFVHLYGAFEYSIRRSVLDCFAVINSSRTTYKECRPGFLCVALDPELNRIATVKKERLWQSRKTLFELAFSDDIVVIREDAIPSDGRNYGYAQLQSIWDNLCVKTPVLPRPALGGIVNELVENRNAIAHGRETPASIGGRNSIDDLNKKYMVIDEVCTHIINSLNHYLAERDYCATVGR